MFTQSQMSLCFQFFSNVKKKIIKEKEKKVSYLQMENMVKREKWLPK